MKSRVNIVGHPVHPILVTLPVGLWSFSVVADLIYHLGFGNDSWKTTALYCLAGGLITALPAMLTGYIDYTGITDPKTRKIGQLHMILNVIGFLLFAASLAWRWNEVAPAYKLGPVIVSVGSLLFLGVSGWLGGELIYRHHASVLTNEELAAK